MDILPVICIQLTPDRLIEQISVMANTFHRYSYILLVQWILHTELRRQIVLFALETAGMFAIAVMHVLVIWDLCISKYYTFVEK